MKHSRHAVSDICKDITLNNILPGQDRFFMRQIKKGGKYGYIMFEDIVNTNYTITNLQGESIKYENVEDLEKDGWEFD